MTADGHALDEKPLEYTRRELSFSPKGLIGVGVFVVLVLVTIVAFYFRGSGSGLGAISSWNNTTSLPAPTYSATSVEYNGFLYEIGGCSTECPTNEVITAPIDFNGVLGSWTNTTNLPTPTYAATSVAYHGYLYEIGGSSGSRSLANVEFAPIQNDGTIGGWKATKRLPVSTNWATSVAYHGYLYEIGGSSGSRSLANVEFAPIQNDGTIGGWKATTRLPIAIHLATSVAYHGYLYEIGGASSTSAVATVEFAPIQNDGTIGRWKWTSALPTGLFTATSVEHNGYLYVMGGNSGSKSVATVEFAHIKGKGTLGPWKPMTILPNVINWATSVTYKDHLYEIGGYDAGGPTSVVTNTEFIGVGRQAK